MDAPQERGAIIFAQGRPIGRSIVPTVVACTCRLLCDRTCKTRVKSPPSPSPTPPPRIYTHVPVSSREGEIHARRVPVLYSFCLPYSLSSLSQSLFFSLSPSPSPSVSLNPVFFNPLRARHRTLYIRTQIYKQQRQRARVRPRTRIVESVALRDQNEWARDRSSEKTISHFKENYISS